MKSPCDSIRRLGSHASMISLIDLFLSASKTSPLIPILIACSLTVTSGISYRIYSCLPQEYVCQQLRRYLLRLFQVYSKHIHRRMLSHLVVVLTFCPSFGSSETCTDVIVVHTASLDELGEWRQAADPECHQAFCSLHDEILHTNFAEESVLSHLRHSLENCFVNEPSFPAPSLSFYFSQDYPTARSQLDFDLTDLQKGFDFNWYEVGMRTNCLLYVIDTTRWLMLSCINGACTTKRGPQESYNTLVVVSNCRQLLNSGSSLELHGR